MGNIAAMAAHGSDVTLDPHGGASFEVDGKSASSPLKLLRRPCLCPSLASSAHPPATSMLREELGDEGARKVSLAARATIRREAYGGRAAWDRHSRASSRDSRRGNLTKPPQRLAHEDQPLEKLPGT
eukprot:CAMPEP_0169408924 /NCGR_PEP_ID=MMETSP1017-20121227/58968_1 /TAXON_ID=342587 /ORGANISM="Karlodinium micrum, Strain CCMP2283" /LENGTH=126 /DNA_ID=CAMNT_0009516077 /DNA_START=346 /DNA_END=727 /DNA_ORIENTATION=-